MQSLKELYKIGRGPSSSHSIGPDRASKGFLARYSDADSYKVILYGSLAHTGKGHLTDVVIKEAFAPKDCEVVFDFDTPCDVHPNTMDLLAIKDGETIGNLRVYSVGGGTIRCEGEELESVPSIYPHSTYADIAKYCRTSRQAIVDENDVAEDVLSESRMLLIPVI